MNIIDGLIQGTPEWNQHRAEHFNASDAPAMLGISQYKTRNQLLHEMATGITPEIDAATQRRFDDGHRFESLARPLAESIIGEELYPVVGSEGKLSASFDGLTMDESICFEHKTLNDKIRDAFASNVIPAEYCAQMEQQLMISGASKCLFMASQFDGNGALVDELHCWYKSDQAMRDNIVQGWTQFAIDLENYQHVQHAEKPKAGAIMDLPALSVTASGMVTYSNLPEFKTAAESYIANINTDLQTDQHFADAEATVKFCKATEEKLEFTKKAILAQTASIDEVIRTVDHIQAHLRDKRLMLDKLVGKEKEARKLEIVSKAGIAFSAHIESLESETRPVRLNVPRPDFAGAIKGKKTLASMHDAVDTALANGKIAADAFAKDIRAKLKWHNETVDGGYTTLFPDMQQIITKPMDDFKLLVETRIAHDKQAEAERNEALRQRIQAEEERKATAKAQAEAEAILAAERRKQAEEERKDEAANHVAHCGKIEEPIKRQQVHQAAESQGVKPQLVPKPARPSDRELIEFVAQHFNVSYGTACDWVIDTAERMRQAA